MLKKIVVSYVLLSLYSINSYAQSSVTLFGALDAGVRFLNHSSAKGGEQINMSSNGYHNNNRIDFAGTEDLGGGLYTHFLLETGFNLGTGALDNTTSQLFQRQAYVGIGGAYGYVDVGRQWTVAHDVLYYYDPFSLTYTPFLPLSAFSDGTRVSNDIKYTGLFNGLSVVADNAIAGTPGDFAQGASRSLGLRYSTGPFSVGGAYGYRNLLAIGTTYTADNYYLAGTSYAIGPVKVFVGYSDEDQKGASTFQAIKSQNIWGGISYDINYQLRLQIANYRTNINNPNTGGYGKNMSAAGLTYSLSKRTDLYGEVDYTTFRGVGITALNPTGQANQTGFTVGMVQKF